MEVDTRPQSKPGTWSGRHKGKEWAKDKQVCNDNKTKSTDWFCRVQGHTGHGHRSQLPLRYKNTYICDLLKGYNLL